MKQRVDLPCDPLRALAGARRMEGTALLHSGRTAYGLGRFSILAAEPYRRFGYRGGRAHWQEGGRSWSERKELFDTLEAALPKGAGSGAGDVEIPFQGGAIGYLGYPAGRFLEPRCGASPDPSGWEARFAWYGGGLVFDHVEERVFLTWEDRPGRAAAERLLEAARSSGGWGASFRLTSPLRSNFSAERFHEAVRRVRQLIREGEVYQVNLAQRLSGACEGDPAELFCRLARRSPAPYAAYLEYGDESIVCSSPERFVAVRSGAATTRPIKGTRPSGESAEEAAAFAADLAGSEKDRSELLMIVDLERNDLGRVCRPGSVRVDDLFRLERYATVIHQTADVSGELEEGVGVVDCIRAMFPGGSITGAPKIRAMQVIEELEGVSRGVYTGSIGYVDRSGRADWNIAIRTIRASDGALSFHVGGGIVWDSDPESEYEETLVKARAMKEAIEGHETK